MQEASAYWPGAGFHSLRHSFASLHIERGTNILRLSRLLGHHSPSFTLSVYGHMLDDGFGEPLDLDAELRVATAVATEATVIGWNGDSPATPAVAVNPTQEAEEPNTPDSAATVGAD